MSINQYFVISGLIVDIIGVIILAFYKPETFNIVHELLPDDKYHPAWVKKVSIFLIVAGFVLQLLGNIL
ncbi:MAG: hypothetical protein WC570_04410 [Patescibacteria group bacterium]